jgi:hypothetical protein
LGAGTKDNSRLPKIDDCATPTRHSHSLIDDSDTGGLLSPFLDCSVTEQFYRTDFQVLLLRLNLVKMI